MRANFGTANAAAASISSVESSQTGQMQLVDLIYKCALLLPQLSL